MEAHSTPIAKEPAMKHLLLPILPVLMLALAPVASAVQAVNAPSPRLEAAIDELEVLVKNRGGTRFDFNRLRTLLVERAEVSGSTFFPTCTVRGRFLELVDDMEARAKRYQLHAEHVLDLELEVIEARLDAAVGDLMVKAAARGATREQFQAAKELLVERARATASELDAETVRERLGYAIEEIESLARVANLQRTHFQRYWAELVENRLERATARLVNRAKLGSATRHDYQRIEILMRERAQIAIDSPPEPCP